MVTSRKLLLGLLLLLAAVAVLLVANPFGAPVLAPAPGDGAAPEPAAPARGEAAPLTATEGPAREQVARARLFTISGRIAARPDFALRGALMHAYRGQPEDRSGVMDSFVANLERMGMPSGEAFGLAVEGLPLVTVPVRADGRFVFEGLPVRHLRLTLEHDHYGLREARPVHVPADTRAIDLGPLEPYLGAHILGRITGLEGPTRERVLLTGEVNPMEMIRDPEIFFGVSLAGGKRTARIDDDGRFELRAVWPSPQSRLSFRDGARRGGVGPFALVSGETREVVIALAPGHELAVHVLGDQGEGLGDADVTVTSQDIDGLMGRTHAARRARTDSEGHCTLIGLAPGTHRLEAEAAGWMQTERELSLATGGGRVEVTLELSRGGSIEGRVLDGDGNPVHDAAVRATAQVRIPLLGDLGDAIGVDVLANATLDSACRTDADGRFRLEGLEDSGQPRSLVAAHPDFVGGITRDVAVGNRDVVIVLERGSVLRGVVVDAATRAPVRNYAVQTTATAFMFMERATSRARVQDSTDGSFRLEAVPAGRVKLAIRANGYGPLERRLTVERDADTDLGVIELATAATVRGRVVSVDGHPVAGATIRRKRGGVFDSPLIGVMLDHHGCRSDQDGRFALDGLQPGRLSLVVTGGGHATAFSERLRLAPGQILDGVEITLGHGGTVVGQLLLPPGEAPDGWEIIPAHPTKGGLDAVRPDPDGRFRIENLEPGRYEVQAFDVDSYNRIQMELGARDPAALIIEATKLAVRKRCLVPDGETVEIVLDARDSEGAPDTTTLTGLVLVGERPMAEGWLEVSAAETTDDLSTVWVENGRFEIAGLRPGEIVLQVRAGLAQAPVGEPHTVVVPRAPRHEVTLRLPAGVIRGRVIDDRNGEPLQSALVKIQTDRPSQADHVANFGYALTGPDGTFSFEGLSEGTYALVADDQLIPTGPERIGGRVDGIRLAAGEQLEDLVLRARRAAGLVVHVTDELGAPLQRAFVFAVDAVGRPFGTLPVAFTDAEGMALLAGLPSGSMRVLARASGYAPGFSDERRTVAGREDSVRVVLRRGIRVIATVRDPARGVLEQAVISVRRSGEPWISGGVLGGKRTPQGEHDLGPLLPGMYDFAISDPTGKTFTVKRRITGARRATLVLEAPSGR